MPEFTRPLPDIPPNLSPQEVADRFPEIVQKLGRSIMQKLLHHPMTNVRRAAADPIDGFDGPVLAEALAALFALRAEEEAAASAAAPAEEQQAEVVVRPEPS